MTAKKTANMSKIEREEETLASVLALMPDNPIPWASVVRLVAPVIARLAVRYALKRLKRNIAEDKVNLIGKATGDFVSGIVEKRS